MLWKPSHHIHSIAIDSMCFIYHFEKNPKYHRLVDYLFSLITQKNKLGITSVITLSETLTVAKKIDASLLFRVQYKSVMLAMHNLRMIDVTLDIAQKAAELRSVHGLHLGDAIQLATAFDQQVDLFVTNDLQFRKIKEMNVAILDDLL